MSDWSVGSDGVLRAFRALAGVLAACAGFVLLLTVTFLLLGIAPFEGLRSLWVGAFGDAQGGRWYAVSETLVKTSPLLLTALGVTVAWRAGLFSIGGEGQLLLGAVTATATVRFLGVLPGPALTLLALVAGAAAGGLWGWFAGWLKVRRNVQEVISTIMLNYVALYLLGWLVDKGPLQESARRVAQSDPLPSAVLFARLIPPAWSDGIATRLHSGVLLAFLAVPAVTLLLFHTRTGFGMRLIGQNPEAARTARYPVGALRLQAMGLSGALCGLAGCVELLGVTGRLFANFSPGWGFTAIPVALLGGLHPVGVLLSALFFGALTAGSGNLARFSGVSSVLIYILQAVAVLAVVGLRAYQALRARSEGD